MGRQPASDFDWVESIEALCVTLVHGLDRAGVVEHLALRALGGASMTLDDVYGDILHSDEVDDSGPCQVAELDGWTLLVELNGYQGSLSGVLAGLSRDGGKAASVFWNVNAVTSFGYAVDGQIVRLFDPGGVDGSHGEPLPEEEGLDFDDPDQDCIRLSLRLLERVTSCTLTKELLLNQRRRCYVAATTPEVPDTPLPAENTQPKRAVMTTFIHIDMPAGVTREQAEAFVQIVEAHGGQSYPVNLILRSAPGYFRSWGYRTRQDAEAAHAEIRAQGVFGAKLMDEEF